MIAFTSKLIMIFGFIGILIIGIGLIIILICLFWRATLWLRATYRTEKVWREAIKLYKEKHFKPYEPKDENSISKDKIKEMIKEYKIKLSDKKFSHDMYEGTEKYNEYIILQAKYALLHNILNK